MAVWQPSASIATMHPLQEPLLSRGVDGSDARLPRNRGVPEGDAQAEGVDRAALRRGETVARDATVPAPGIAEGEHRGAVHRGGAESETLIECDGLGDDGPGRDGAVGIARLTPRDGFAL